MHVIYDVSLPQSEALCFQILYIATALPGGGQSWQLERVFARNLVKVVESTCSSPGQRFLDRIISMTACRHFVRQERWPVLLPESDVRMSCGVSVSLSREQTTFVTLSADTLSQKKGESRCSFDTTTGSGYQHSLSNRYLQSNAYLQAPAALLCRQAPACGGEWRKVVASIPRLQHLYHYIATSIKHQLHLVTG